MHDEALYADRAAGAGASGFVAKQRAGGALLPAIEHILKGEYYFTRSTRRSGNSVVCGESAFFQARTYSML